MGFKPFHLRILHIKLRFYLNLHLRRNKCTVSQRCLDLLKAAVQSDYLENLRELMEPLGVSLEEVSDSTLTVLEGPSSTEQSTISGPLNFYLFLWSFGRKAYMCTRIKLGKRETLASCLNSIRSRYKLESRQELLHLFLGQEMDLTRTQLIHRGFALERLVDSFFEQWSAKLNRTISRRPGLVLAIHLLIFYSFLYEFSYFNTLYSFLFEISYFNTLGKALYCWEVICKTYISSHTTPTNKV